VDHEQSEPQHDAYGKDHANATIGLYEGSAVSNVRRGL
jgi:hypothetical protein